MRVAHLHAQREGNTLHGVISAIYKVPHEDEVRIRRGASDLQNLDKIVQLAVDIAHYGAGSSHNNRIRLLPEYLQSSLTQVTNLVLCQLLVPQKFGQLLGRGNS